MMGTDVFMAACGLVDSTMSRCGFTRYKNGISIVAIHKFGATALNLAVYMGPRKLEACEISCRRKKTQTFISQQQWSFDVLIKLADILTNELLIQKSYDIFLKIGYLVMSIHKKIWRTTQKVESLFEPLQVCGAFEDNKSFEDSFEILQRVVA